MYFFLKYIVTLFYKKLKIKIVVCLFRESVPRFLSLSPEAVYFQFLFNYARFSPSIIAYFQTLAGYTHTDDVPISTLVSPQHYWVQVLVSLHTIKHQYATRTLMMFLSPLLFLHNITGFKSLYHCILSNTSRLHAHWWCSYLHSCFTTTLLGSSPCIIAYYQTLVSNTTNHHHKLTSDIDKQIKGYKYKIIRR